MSRWGFQEEAQIPGQQVHGGGLNRAEIRGPGRCQACCRRPRFRSPGPESPDRELQGPWRRGLRLRGVLFPLWVRGCPPRPPPFPFSFPLSLNKALPANFRQNASPLPALSAPGSPLVREGRGGAQWARTTQPARPSVGPAGPPGWRAHAQTAGGTASPGSSLLAPGE